MSNLSLIVAMDKNGLIGRDNSLPWSLPSDLKYFKEKTTGHPVVMGRKTFESIGRPLPNRTNIVLTRDSTFKEAGCEVVSNVDKVVELCEKEEVFIIGGKQVYELFFPFVDKIYLTLIDEEFIGDTKLSLDLANFNEVKSEKGIRNEQNPHNFYFKEYVRKENL